MIPYATFALGFLIGVALMSVNFSEESVKQNIKSLYELANPETSVEIVSLKEESGIYKMILKSSGARTEFIELFATKDGKLLTQSLKNFVDCVDLKNLKIYGISNQTATLLQLNLLETYSPKIFIPCDPIEICLNEGIREVPSIIFENKTYVGVQSINSLEAITGCKFG